jgi:hypothetical protein
MSNDKIDLFMANTIIEMRLIGHTINSEHTEDKLVEQQTLVQTFQVSRESYQLV